MRSNRCNELHAKAGNVGSHVRRGEHRFRWGQISNFQPGDVEIRDLTPMVDAGLWGLASRTPKRSGAGRRPNCYLPASELTRVYRLVESPIQDGGFRLPLVNHRLESSGRSGCLNLVGKGI